MAELKIYREKDIDLELIKSKKIAIIGFGSQGFGQGMNLKDSGCNLVLGLRLGGKSDEKAKRHGFKTVSIEDAVKWADVVQILIPDEVQQDVYKKQIEPYLESGQYLMFSHGFNVHYGYITPPKNVNVIMVAPKAPGHTVRGQYCEMRGVPSLIAVDNDFSGDSKDVALSYAAAIGSAKAGIIETTFKEETETDLFGEQTVICGGVDYLIKSGFETLVEAGYSPYMAYFEVCHELKLIVDLIYEGGIEDMHYSISNNAEYGDYTCGSKVIDSSVKERMKKVLLRIQDGSYADEFMKEFSTGNKTFNKLREDSQNHLIEKIGAEIRSEFSWANKNKLINKNIN